MSKRSHRDSVSDTDVDIAGNDLQSASARIVVVSREDNTTPRKLVNVDSREDDAPEVMRCTLPPHRTPIVFSSYEDYEVHYAQNHVNRCLQCRRNFPTAHYLTLHIEENHDPLTDSKRDRGEKTYRCFVEGCEKLCSTPQKRRMHLIDKHAFPKMYNFYVISDGLDGRHSLLREERRSKPAQGTTNPGAREGRLRYRHEDEARTSRPPVKGTRLKSKEPAVSHGLRSESIDDLTASMSALKFVPNSVRLGRPKQK